MDLPFPPGHIPGTLHPAPAAEQARLHRLLAAHAPPAAPFGDVLPAGSFHTPVADRLGAVEPMAADPAHPVKIPFTFAF